MKVFAAKYTACRYEYAPAVISLHKTFGGAEKAIEKSKSDSRNSFNEMKEYLKHATESRETEAMCWHDDDEWTSEDGDGFEQWAIGEMEVEE